MRAWTIVLFILAFHACTAMFTYTDIMNTGINSTVDTYSKTGFVVSSGNGSVVKLPYDPSYFDPNATGQDIKGSSVAFINSTSFVGRFIESILGFGETFITFVKTFSGVITGIHYLSKPYFGDFNAWVLEGIVDTIFAVSLVQIVTGRSFKTMD